LFIACQNVKFEALSFDLNLIWFDIKNHVGFGHAIYATSCDNFVLELIIPSILVAAASFVNKGDFL